jgi:hypothetical protein
VTVLVTVSFSGFAQKPPKGHSLDSQLFNHKTFQMNGRDAPKRRATLDLVTSVVVDAQKDLKDCARGAWCPHGSGEAGCPKR